MLVLDATCSLKRRWPEVADVRLDMSLETKPDVCGDDKHLPFADEVFDEVYADPPHLVKSWKNKSPLVSDDMLVGLDEATQKATEGYKRFTIWGGMDDFYQYLDAVNVEFARVIKPDGKLMFKSTDGSRSHGTTIRVTDVIAKLTRFEVVEDKKVESSGYFARWHKKHHGTTTFTHYVTFRKKGVV